LFLVHRFLSPWWRRLQVPPKRRFLQEPHGVTTQKTPFFMFLILSWFSSSRCKRCLPPNCRSLKDPQGDTYQKTIFFKAGTCLMGRYLAMESVVPLLSNGRRYTYTESFWWEGFVKYAVKIDSDAMIYIYIYISNFIKHWYRHSYLAGGIQRQHGDCICLLWENGLKGDLPERVAVCPGFAPRGSPSVLYLKVGCSSDTARMQTTWRRLVWASVGGIAIGKRNER
jgi:hypothetical protein